VNAFLNFTSFDGDIIPTYKSIAAGYGVDYANELVKSGLMEATSEERGTAPTLDLWKQSWNETLEMWEVFVYFHPFDYTDEQISTIKTAIRRLQ
jgi:hypothetical protein